MKLTTIMAATALLFVASPASAFSWQQFWTGVATPEDSFLNKNCGTLEVGFLKAAPCLSNIARRMAILHPHPAGQLVAQDLAEVIDTVAAQVRNGTKTEQEAYAAYDAQRTELAKLNRTIHNSQMARGMTESLERSFEIDRINRCIANPRYGC